MRISKKAEYAMRALCALARRPARAILLIEEISGSEHIPAKFLEQILLELRRADLLRSKRGLGGGYQLNRKPAEIPLAEVIRIIDGPFEPISCTGPDPEKFGHGTCECGAPGGCGIGRTFTDLQRQVNAFLGQTTIADVIAGEHRSELSFDI
ncbi:MAG: Rrf2 family transcriptional regulator [Verrucomicrobiales bacterium]|nr:Rrf2 family transcriptional regulator [Verrucomicrobiales bacterium]